jgi:coenzyme Q-binding protein COQ10
MPSHQERRLLPYTPQQLYALVADVERYPEFLPWAAACRIQRRQGALIWADLIIGFKMIRERFTSRIALDPEGLRIDVAYVDGPFKHLSNRWVFEPHPEGCMVDFAVDFAFRSPMLDRMIGALFHEAVRRMVQAFEGRAYSLYSQAQTAASSPTSPATP